MSKYLFHRVLRALLSVTAVVAIVMLLVYTCLDRDLVFANDPVYSKQASNGREVYKMQQWERYGYVDYIPYGDYLKTLLQEGTITQAIYESAVRFGDIPQQDSPEAARYIRDFTAHYEQKGYRVLRLNADKKGKTDKYKEGGEPRLFAYKDIPVFRRLWRFASGLVQVDNIHYVREDLENRGLTFTLYDPAYGGDVLSPAILGNGTRHKYLLYFDDRFPYIHQNLVKLNLGQSYSISTGTEVLETLTASQGSFVYSQLTYPSGLTALSADDLHTAKYVAGSLENGTAAVGQYYIDDYTAVQTRKNGLSKLGYSFTIGMIAVLVSYGLAIPVGMLMARRKDKLADKLGTGYIVFIMAVPTLAYIFLFKAIGGSLGLPTTFDMENPTWLMYVLPIVSLALPAAANIMKWLRRYMIDHMNADYVKFARAGGLGEGEIFRKHVLRNAVIPIVHGIPAAVLFALTGAIITERVYVVPGAGNMLTRAINAYDNGVIVGMTLFYAVLSVVSAILGDIFLSLADPRITFSANKR